MNSDQSTTIRRQSRELAVQILFQKEFSQEIDIDASLGYFKEVLQAPDAMWAYARVIATGVLDNLELIDNKISSLSQNWSLSRMSSVDLNVLRVAVFEIEFASNDVPPKVAVNEAIEIGKKYGTTESSSFINGILNELIKEHGAENKSS